MTNLRHIQFCGVDAPPRASPGSGRALAGCESRLCGDGASRPGARTDTAELDPFLDWLLRLGSVDPTKYRTTAVNRRLPACLRLLRASSPDAAREIIRRRPALMAPAISTVLIGVTEFFREREVFDAVRRLVLPTLESAPVIRILSAGVSRGHELYSMAMLLADAEMLHRCELLGVDCRADAIAAAAAGRFDADELTSMDVNWRERYFSERGDACLAAPELRHRMRWQVADLSSFTTAPLFNVVLFRSVVIYFENKGALDVWERICAGIVDGGFLITGKAERPPAHLPLTRIAPCIHLKTSA